MKLGLAMLVKNGAKTLPATLASVLPVIDSYTVLDTGSRDRTKAIINDTIGHLPGRIKSAKFEGFGKSRTKLLELARGSSDYLLMVDADHVLHVEGEKPDLTADSYLLRIRGELEWRLPLLTRADHPFEYRGAAHSYLHSDVPTVSEPLDWLSIDGGPGATIAKLKRDRQLLEQAFLENPDDARTVFYLAQTYRFLGMYEEAIKFYRLRASMNGFAEERYYARHQLGCLLSEHVAFEQGAGELLFAWLERPTRAESLRALAHAANAVADKIDKPDDVLFVSPDAYRSAA